MITFKPEKHVNYLSFFDEFISFENKLLIMTIFFFVFFPSKFKDPVFFILITSFFQIVTLLQKRKMVEIGFDTKNNYLHFYSKGYFTKPKKLKTSFEQMYVELDKKLPPETSFFKIKRYQLCIMKEKTEVFKLDMATDDFTEQTLDAIVAQFKQLGIPVQ